MPGSNILKICFSAHNTNPLFIFDGLYRYDLGVKCQCQMHLKSVLRLVTFLLKLVHILYID